MPFDLQAALAATTAQLQADIDAAIAADVAAALAAQPPPDCSAQQAIIAQRDATITALQAEKATLQTSLNTCLADLEECEGEPEPPPPPPPPPPTGSIPLTFNDPRFAGNTVSSPFTGSGTLLKKTITQTGNTASIVQTGGLLIIDTCRVGPPSREGIRVTSGIDVRNSYLDCIGQGQDHADTIQAYSPGQIGGIIKLTDTAVVAHNTAATAGLFVADSWGGTVTLKNVMFQGGPFGCRIHADPGKTVSVSLEDVFFVGPFAFDALLISAVGSGVLNITKWERVRNATIVNGVLVPGTFISRP